MADYKDQKAKLAEGLRRLHAVQRRDYENHRRAEQTFVGDLSVNDVAQVVADLLAEQKRDLVQHMARLRQLDQRTAAHAAEHAEEHRINLTKRVLALESEVRLLNKKGGRR